MKTAIIIGAGPAGLTAAYELLTKTDIIPIILDIESQVGGISRTVNYKNNRIDLGGHRFFSKYDEIINWWFKFISLEPADERLPVNIAYQHKTKTVNKNAKANTNSLPDMMIRQRKSRIYYRESFFDYPLSINMSLIRNLGPAKMFRILASYLWAKCFPRKQEKTLRDFFINRFGNELYQTFFKTYTEKVWGVKCDDLPSSWGHQRIKDLNIAKAVKQVIKSLFVSNKSITQKGTSTSLIEQFLYPKYGPGQMWEAVAAEIIRLGGQIRLQTEVTRICADENNMIRNISVSNLCTLEETVLSGDVFISTMPVKDLINNLQHPFPDSHIKELANGLEYRDFIIAGLLINTVITEPGKSDQQLKDNWIYLQDGNIKAGRLQIFNNWSPFMVNDPSTSWISVEYFCNETDEFWKLTDQEIAERAICEIESIGLVKADQLIDYKIIRVKKAYPSYTGTYEHFDQIKNYLNNFANLYPVGRNGMHRYNNTDHSMMTAMLTVKNIIENNTDKNNIWEVNMDDNYHEQK